MSVVTLRHSESHVHNVHAQFCVTANTSQPAVREYNQGSVCRRSYLPAASRSDNSSGSTLVYFPLSVYEVKPHNRATGSADVSAPSLPRVCLTPLEIENGEGLVRRQMVGRHTNTPVHRSISHSWNIYVSPSAAPCAGKKGRYF